MSKKNSVEFESDFLEKFFFLADSPVPEEVKQDHFEEKKKKHF